ncbi:MAG: hypothetical protein IPJ61_18995 [Tessaracoccus sp.]|jgi:hypothetical protein|uniref:hypothetical protein n=1 Tax=Tessaracoccus sp. TaxID=1971211 RepID=UPI001EC02786|nr:hypothetical protein [Tessaracoccus sp.]MBK7823074.1 hypothetical protein [Tessaracoccus sp.]
MSKYKRPRSSRGLGAPAADHIASARHELSQVWVDLERMPSNCEGGIRLTARAIEAYGRARAHLNSVDGPEREANTQMYGEANFVGDYLNQRMNRLAVACVVPGAVRDLPLTSRATYAQILRERAEKARKQARRAR